MIKDEALKMAIKALDTLMMEKGSIYYQAINACKEALEQPTVAELNNEYLRDTNVIGLEQPAQEPRLVSYAPDGSTCTLNIDGEEVYFNCEQPTITYEQGFAHGYEAHRAEQALEQPAQSEYMVNEGGTGTVLRKQPAQKPQYLYLYNMLHGKNKKVVGQWLYEKPISDTIENEIYSYVGKIKLETNNDKS
jgi:hypothetical protein